MPKRKASSRRPWSLQTRQPRLRVSSHKKGHARSRSAVVLRELVHSAIRRDLDPVPKMADGSVGVVGSRDGHNGKVKIYECVWMWRSVDEIGCWCDPARGSADWEAARAYSEKGLLHEGRIDGFNGGGLLVRFYSLVGFLPYPQLSPYHSCKEPNKSIQDIAEALRGSIISVKVIVADQANKKLIFSEKEAMWSKFSGQVNIGDLFEGRVCSIEDYGAFVHLRFPDGSYCLTGLVHISEVSWNIVQDIRDILNVDDEVRVKLISIDREKSRLALSIKQLEEDPLLETLENVIPQDGSADPTFSGASNPYSIEPLPGLETVLDELRQEEGISDVRISRQGFEKRVVSPDLQLWLSNAPPIDKKFTLLARAGREVQMIQLTTSLDQEGIKRALQRVLERIP
ncbi:hypothetical protein RHGRI_026155 [Rhododendron griersonianum]|uniref:S1 motif domain-containing protein n=1 Tax=Rhododendron griersonianum TaxID=479676 RepID=A0AAV6IRV6_9ERIC|nr:hypothetical protein RHGRI_026155 [Rhododendron griersonianum]